MLVNFAVRAVVAPMILALLAPGQSGATTDCAADAMVVFDGSGSMAEMGFNLLNEPRILSAREAVRDSIPDVARHRKLGLVIYGPGGGSTCSNVELRFAPVADAAPRIIAAVDGLDPAGETPLTDAVETAAETLDYKTRPGVVVLVTDGKETCGGTPCQTAARMKSDAVDLTIHVIGFKLESDHFNWPSAPASERDEGHTVAKCMADITGGKYVTSDTVAELAAALRNTLGCAVFSDLDVDLSPVGRPAIHAAN